MSEWSEELAFAARLADVADAITMQHFRADIRVDTKADGTPVTEADQATERALREEIAARFPDHAIVGEEEGATGQASHRWILDPIDGTKSYAAGIPVWATLIALEVAGDVVCGVVSAPAIGERYAASRGGGATCNGEPIGVSGVDHIDEARVCYTSYRSFAAAGRGDGFDRLCDRARWARGFGDFWGHMLVAAGRADVMCEPVVNIWDLAPLIVIVEEAGGLFTDLDGDRRIDNGSALTTNGRLHTTALSLLSPR